MGEDCEWYGDRYTLAKTGAIEVHGEIKRETDKAILFHNGDQEVWMPKSQIYHREDNNDGACMLEVPEWLALEKGLI